MTDFIDQQALNGLAGAIVMQAVRDWVMLLRYGVQSFRKASFEETERFFTTQYGEMLCDMAGVESYVILAKLRQWKADTERTGTPPKAILHIK